MFRVSAMTLYVMTLHVTTTPLQIHFPNIFLDYDPRRRIETTLYNSTHMKSDGKKCPCYFDKTRDF